MAFDTEAEYVSAMLPYHDQMVRVVEEIREKFPDDCESMASGLVLGLMVSLPSLMTSVDSLGRYLEAVKASTQMLAAAALEEFARLKVEEVQPVADPVGDAKPSGTIH